MLTRTLLAILLVAPLSTACEGPPDPLSTQTSALSLSGSKFEIDTSANLVVNTAGNLDWATVDDVRLADTSSGTSDNSYKGGAKEDDPCPPVETGSIPNNKSDLRTFGAYVESGATPSAPGFLNLFWHRVQDPTGTTLMDFEFNQSSTVCANGVNLARSAGDLLLEYRLEQGGATATIKMREWSGTAWGDATDLTALGDAYGTINSSAIAATDADGLGAISARTFGEASISLASIFDAGKCMTYGSALVKSRSSDSFTSALKDFISPIPINISNCGQVVIRKETDPDGASGTFGFTHTLSTDPASATSFSLGDGQAKTFSNVLFGTGYTVTESSVASGFDLKDIDCSASSGVTITKDLATRRITFDIDSDSDKVDCTYTNRARGTLVVQKVTSDGSGTFDFTSAKLGDFSLTTTGAGTSNKVSKTFADLVPDTYAVAETVPTGWYLASSSCSDGSGLSAIGVGAGETVTCTFVNARQRGAIEITKTRNHAAFGAGPWPHAGVSFQITGGEIATPITVVTDVDGKACVDDLVLSSFVGNYTVTELVPTGYQAAGDLAKNVSITSTGSCASGATTVGFHNLPLTNLTCSVDSQIPGGTTASIQCSPGPSTPVLTDATGDGSLTLSNLLAGTYTCTIVIE